jgi:hypothetical protein
LGPIVEASTKVINLQYIDDTLIFPKADNQMVENLNWLFYVLERISGLKVNFIKSEYIPLNLSSTQSSHFAQILGYKLDKYHLNI